MIPEMTSHELNKILVNANDKLSYILNEVNVIKNDIFKKMAIMRYESEYNQYELVKLLNNSYNTSGATSGDIINKFTLFTPEFGNTFEVYGSTATPSFIMNPFNVFNILATATGEAFYRDIAEVAINGIIKDEYKDILKHDNIIDKSIYFVEVTDEVPTINLSIKIDTTKTLGNSMFNVIEFDPFFSGSYTINSIKIYSQENNDTYEEYTGYENAGRMRIVLNKEYNLYKVDFNITPNYSVTSDGIKKTIAGIKHIYFYNAKFISNAYAVAVIESDKYIDSIQDNISIKTPNQTIDSTISNENIELYLNHTINPTTGEHVFSSKQEISYIGSTNPISFNVKKIYAKIPIKEQSLIGITFKISTKLF